MNTITLNKMNRIALAVLFGLMIFTTGCSKSDNANPLNGTTWIYDKSGSGYEYKATITFQTENYSFKETDNDNGSITAYTGQGSYVYDNQKNIHLTGSISEDSGTSSTWTADGTVSGNQMILIINNLNFVFVKQ